MNYYYNISLFIISFISSGWLTWFLIKFLINKQILDNPEARSNHNIAKPRGGGIATIIIFCLIYPIFSYWAYNEYYNSLILSVLVFSMGMLGFRDDIKSISPLLRFIAQIAIISLMIQCLFPDNNLILPHSIDNVWDKILLILLTTYFVNIYNFMDGIDGITATNTIAIMLGVLGVIIVNNLDLESVTYLISIIIGCCCSFLIFNWAPSKIFYGDGGSLTLGMLTAYALLKIAFLGYFGAALLIAGYYLFDASVTIIRRLVAREKIWQAHSKHFYQLAVRRGHSHSQVVIAIAIINIILILVSIIYLPINNIPILQNL